MDEQRTFTELGIPFPLFDAPAKFASRYVGEAVCTLCEKRGACFKLGIGDYVLDKCGRCGAVNGLPKDSGATHTTCHSCGNLIPIPKSYRDATACYACLRDGRVCLTQDTESGMVSWEHLIGVNDEGSPAVDISREWIAELTCTPTYSSIQGESWQFHCERPMIYVGEWGRSDFDRHTPGGDGKALFEQSVGDSEPGLWDAMWSGGMHDEFAIYMFYCPVCTRYRGHWDMF